MQRENESWSACDQPIREENVFDKKKRTYDLLHFLEGTLLILITYHLQNELKKQNKAQAYNALVTFVVLRFENVNI